MPDRIIRAGILKSEAVNELSWPAEVFYRRLMSAVDDYGRYEGRSIILRADLYPLKVDKVSISDIDKWKAECAKAGLVRFYGFGGKEYLEVLNFGQRLRSMKSKYPGPPTDDDIGGHPLAYVSIQRPESEAETETETITPEEGKSSAQAPRPPNFKKLTEDQFMDLIAKHIGQYPKEMLRSFFDYWREKSASGIMRFQLEKTWDTALRLKTWKQRDKTFIPKNGQQMEITGAPPLKTLR